MFILTLIFLLLFPDCKLQQRFQFLLLPCLHCLCFTLLIIRGSIYVLEQNYINLQMLTQQNMLTEHIHQQTSNSNIILHKIDCETNNFRNLLAKVRLHRKKSSGESALPYDSQNQSEISNIDFVSQKMDKNSFQIDLQTDIKSKKNACTMTPILFKQRPIPKECGDEGLKYKPRSGVNGRDDIRIRNLQEIHRKVSSPVQKSHHEMKSEHGQKMWHKSDALDNPENNTLLQLNLTKFKISSPTKHKVNEVLRKQSQTERFKKTSNYDELITPNNKTLKVAQKMSKIPEKEVQSYIENLRQQSLLHYDSSPDKIYQFFMNLCANFGIESEFNEPLIKRYRNCIYFGQKVPSDSSKNTNQNYMGFVWYFRKALYYGEFRNGRKNGLGVEVDLQQKGNQCTWKGNFSNGKKTGHFELISPKLEYNGALVNSYFEGEGTLKVKGYSLYKGEFQAGMKHGFGVENFENSKSLNYKGEYFENMFEGKGQLEGPNYLYKGEFKNSKAHGTGFEETGQFQYEGEFRNGKKEGQGIIKLASGQKYKGIFKNGQLVQEIANNSPPSSAFSVIKNTNKMQLSNGSKTGFVNQYTKSIKIQSFKQSFEQSTLSPSQILTQQSAIKLPSQLLEQNQFLDQNMSENQKSPLCKNLSKRLNSLHEQAECDEGTVDEEGKNEYQAHNLKPNSKKLQKVQGAQTLLTRQHPLRNLMMNGEEDQDEPLQIKVLPRD